MKIIFTAIYVLGLSFSVIANADCIKNKFGNIVCGKGQCESDRFGKIYCAEAGGGAINDQHGNVNCGVGFCEKDYLGQVWCSKEAGGDAKIDSYGKVVCLGGCDLGTTNRCKEAQ